MIPSPPPTEERKVAERNFWSLGSFNILQRVGWVFKLESVVIPAFLDAIGGGGTARGLLPLLARLGASIPQFLAAPRVEAARRLARVLRALAFAQAAPWLLLALALRSAEYPGGPPWAIGFLALYFLSASIEGITQLTQASLQGRVIEPTRRGRLLSLSYFTGSLVSVAAILVWLWPRLGASLEASGFAALFAATGVLYLASAAPLLLLVEPEVKRERSGAGFASLARESARSLRHDPQFRRLLLVVCLYFFYLVPFPHYATFGRARLGAGASDLVVWIVAQNLGLALVSLGLGRFADRAGYRQAVLIVLAGLAIVPLLAMGIGRLDAGLGRWLYPLVFFSLGCSPASQRILANYVLEWSGESARTGNLAIVTLLQLVPLTLAPVIGWLMDRGGYEIGFLAGSAPLALAAWLARTLPEPRARTGRWAQSGVPPLASPPGAGNDSMKGFREAH